MGRRKGINKGRVGLFSLLISVGILIVVFVGYYKNGGSFNLHGFVENIQKESETGELIENIYIDPDSIPEYSGKAYTLSVTFASNLQRLASDTSEANAVARLTWKLHDIKKVRASEAD